MIVRCFEGRSVPEVMERIWRELGEEAVILHTQQRRSFWQRLSRRAAVRVWAAIPPREPMPEGSPSEPHVGHGLCPAPTKKPSPEEHRPAQPIDGLRDITAQLERQLQILAAFLWDEREMAKEPNVLSWLWRCGVDLGMARSLWQAFVAQPDAGEDERQRLQKVLSRQFSVTGGVSSEPTVVVLVGPTGVGKTTTIAKIAANELLHRRRRVALVTVDVFRIGAVQQLETYARLMGLPFFVATVKEEAQRCLSAARRVADVVLIDTIGRNPRQTEHLTALHELVAAMEPNEVHLTLPANGNPADLLVAAEQFSLFKPTCLLFTKLDEAAQPGVIVNIVHRFPLPVSYITTGQNVPDDIEVAVPERLAALVLSPLEREVVPRA